MSKRSLAEWRALVDRGALNRRQVAELKADGRAGAQALFAGLEMRRRAVRVELKRLDAMLAFERAAREQGFTIVAGVDEAGRGPLAGPIVAAAVILSMQVGETGATVLRQAQDERKQGQGDREQTSSPFDISRESMSRLAGVNDSKMLTHEEREALYVALMSGGHGVGVAEVAHEEIDRFGIQAANYRAMVLAVGRLSPPPDFVLVDGLNVRGLATPQQRIVKGDRLSLSIAAASIIAKVHRDRIMTGYDAAYPEYGFARHKGYSTPEHLDALARYGPCPIHRRSFAPIAAAQESGELF